MNIQLSKPCRKPPLANRRKLLRILKAILPKTGLDPAAPGILQIVTVDRETISGINRQFLDHEGPTDVIAFGYPPEPGEIDTAAPEPVVGELFVCLPVAVEAAERCGTSVSFELILYSTHGMLHLAGYDDQAPEAEREMRAMESNIMTAIEAEFGTADVISES